MRDSAECAGTERYKQGMGPELVGEGRVPTPGIPHAPKVELHPEGKRHLKHFKSKNGKIH